MASSCNNCLYFENNYCRRAAPQVWSVTTSPVWPAVKATDWCGEWRSTDDDFRINEDPNWQTAAQGILDAIEALTDALIPDPPL